MHKVTKAAHICQIVITAALALVTFVIFVMLLVPKPAAAIMALFFALIFAGACNESVEEFQDFIKAVEEIDRNDEC